MMPVEKMTMEEVIFAGLGQRLSMMARGDRWFSLGLQKRWRKGTITQGQENYARALVRRLRRSEPGPMIDGDDDGSEPETLLDMEDEG